MLVNLSRHTLIIAVSVNLNSFAAACLAKDISTSNASSYTQCRKSAPLLPPRINFPAYALIRHDLPKPFSPDMYSRSTAIIFCKNYAPPYGSVLLAPAPVPSACGTPSKHCHLQAVIPQVSLMVALKQRNVI